jgi:hypothetical protein
MTPRSERFKHAISLLESAPAEAIASGLTIEEPGPSFAKRTLAYLEIHPVSSHIIVGPPGTGKSTQLGILHRDLSTHEVLVPLYIDASAVTVDLERRGALSRLLLTRLREFKVAQQGNIKDTRFNSTAFYSLMPGKLALGAFWLMAKLKHAAKVICILDLHDQISVEKFEALRRGDLADIMPLMPVIVSAPQSALRQRAMDDHVESFDQCTRRLARDPAQGDTMREFLIQVVTRRTDDLIPPECCANLIDASGGVLGDLLGLARIALDEAYMAGYNRVEPRNVRFAVDKLGRRHLADLDSHDRARLHHLRLTGAFVRDERDLNLLATRRVLEYANPTGGSTFVVHPTLLPLLEPPDVLAEPFGSREVSPPPGYAAAPSATTTDSDSSHVLRGEANEDLHRLLLSMFSSAEQFRQWVALGPDGQKLVGEFPGSSVSASAAISEGLDVLRHHGHLDGSFFKRLLATYPRRKDDIVAVLVRITH